MSDNIENFYNRRFLIEIYQEWSNYNDILEYCQNHYRYFLAIEHNQDIWTESDYKEKQEYMDNNNIHIGDNKKIHTHIVVRFENPRYRNTIANELNIDNRFVIEPKKKVKLITNERYLLHLDNDDKHLYNFNELIGTDNAKLHLKKSINKDIEIENKVVEILDYIDTDLSRLRTTDVVREMCKRGYYGEFRNGWSIFKQVIEEHNTGITLGINEYNNPY